jgi:hypothetical protein
MIAMCWIFHDVAKHPGVETDRFAWIDLPFLLAGTKAEVLRAKALKAAIKSDRRNIMMKLWVILDSG